MDFKIFCRVWHKNSSFTPFTKSCFQNANLRLKPKIQIILTIFADFDQWFWSYLVDFDPKIGIFLAVFPGAGNGKFPGERGASNQPVPRDSPGRDSPGSSPNYNFLTSFEMLLMDNLSIVFSKSSHRNSVERGFQSQSSRLYSNIFYTFAFEYKHVRISFDYSTKPFDSSIQKPKTLFLDVFRTQMK